MKIQRSPSGHHARRGTTVLEMVVVVTLVGLIATVTVRLFHAMLRQQATAAEQFTSSLAMTRLRDRFVKDVNSATDATIADARLLLTTRKGTGVRWEATEEFALRTVDDGSGPRMDHFDIPTGYAIRFETAEIAQGESRRADSPPLTLIHLHWIPNRTQRDDRYVAIRPESQIVAELSRDHHWQARLDPEPRPAEVSK